MIDHKREEKMNKSQSKYFKTGERMNLALISLLKKKPLEYITVKELCEAAGVHRSTFYLHYENIGDLLEETARYLLDDFFSYFPTDKKEITFQLSTCELDDLNFITDEYLTPYLTYIKDHKTVFLTVILNVKSLGFDSVYKRLFKNIFNPILDRFHYSVTDREYVMMYYLNGINAIILEWLKADCQKSTDEIAKIISLCIYGLKRE